VSVVDDIRLDGQVALVIGASRGIGEDMALAFAEAGADVALVGRGSGQLSRVAGQVAALGRRAKPVVVDVSDPSALPGMMNSVLDYFGRIDILANVAGVQRRMPVLDAQLEDWDYVINTNIRAVYFVCQAVGKVMTAQRRGKIINIASMVSFRGFADLSLYGISKAAVAHFTKSLAVEWAPYNIQVNAIAPGWIETEMVANMRPERRRWVEEHLPQGHFGVPRDIAGLGVFLASRASDYLTGQIIAVDGGFMAGNPWPAPPES
jgi:2-dehydro-3-deoxy-D-gluconate 5-dehydrogenase